MTVSPTARLGAELETSFVKPAAGEPGASGVSWASRVAVTPQPKVRTTWTILSMNGPNHLGLRLMA